jgi:hypothetical protein
MSRLRFSSFRTVILWSLALALFIGLLYAVLRKFRYRRYGFVTRTYLEFRDLLGKRGVRVTDSMTAGDLLKFSRNDGFGIEAEEFLKLYESHRFGSLEMTDSVRQRYRGLLKKLSTGKRTE